MEVTEVWLGMLLRTRSGCRSFGQLKYLTTAASKQSASQELLRELRRNPELTEEDAVNELRWITQAAGSSKQLGRGHNSLDGTIRSMVIHRGDGVPLQYVIGELNSDLRLTS